MRTRMLVVSDDPGYRAPGWGTPHNDGSKQNIQGIAMMPRAAWWVGGLFDHSSVRFLEFVNIVSLFVAGVFFAWEWLAVTVCLVFLVNWMRWHGIVTGIGKRRQGPAMNSPRSRADQYSKARHVAHILTMNIQKDALFLAAIYGLGSGIRWAAAFA